MPAVGSKYVLKKSRTSVNPFRGRAPNAGLLPLRSGKTFELGWRDQGGECYQTVYAQVTRRHLFLRVTPTTTPGTRAAQLPSDSPSTIPVSVVRKRGAYLSVKEGQSAVRQWLWDHQLSPGECDFRLTHLAHCALFLFLPHPADRVNENRL